MVARSVPGLKTKHVTHEQAGPTYQDHNSSLKEWVNQFLQISPSWSQNTDAIYIPLYLGVSSCSGMNWLFVSLGGG